MQKRRLHLDREVVTSMVAPADRRFDEQVVGGVSIPGTPTSVWSIIISILSIRTLPPETDPSGQD